MPHGITLHIWPVADCNISRQQVNDGAHESALQTWFSVPIPRIGEMIVLGRGSFQTAGVVFHINHCFESPDESHTHVDAYEVPWPP